MTHQNTELLQDLVEIARDGAEFYENAQTEIDNATLKGIFARMAAAKRELIATLSAKIAQRGEQAPVSGTTIGAIRELYANVLASLSKKDDKIYVAQLEQAEDRLLAHFEDALQECKDADLSRVLLAQLPKARACHDEMAALKQRLAA